MSENNTDSKNQEYKGVSKTASVLGHSVVDGFKGLAVGGAIGATIGAVTHNKEIQAEASERAFSNFEKLMKVTNLSEAEKFSNIKLSNVLKTGWDALGRKGKAAVGAAVIGIGAAIVSMVIGLFHGRKKANAAREQFNEITSENKELKGKLSGIETAAEIVSSKQKSYVADLENKRSQQTTQTTSLA